ncbi:MAG: class I SAM-dependent RNA methyltransferase [Filomicrobium sp.]
MRVTIDKLGAQGDGIARIGDQDVFVPFALPGEEVEVALEDERAQLMDVVAPSPQRIQPVCEHFGVCGGCSLQHLNRDDYRAWKRSLVSSAFAARGIAVDLSPTVEVGLGGRRRVVLTARRQGRDIELGFLQAGRHVLVDLAECPVAAPDILRVLPGLRQLLVPLVSSGEDVRVTILRAENGLDVNVVGGAEKLSPRVSAELSQRSAELGLLRLSLDDDPIYQAGLPIIKCGPAEVAPPPGVFLQASAEAESEMAKLIVSAFGKRAKRVADLFCGVGAFSFPLASRAKVLAIDSEARAIDALEEADRRTQGVKGIETRVRDLFQEPLSRKELEPFDLVVFDPPRAGAKAQAASLAKSKVPIVVAVSCNLATAARDLRTLIDGGYRLVQVTPIDQFLFSPHVEVVCVLKR